MSGEHDARTRANDDPITGRTLIVMRHAKAENGADTDHPRVLAPRGERAARESGSWLAARGWVPDQALVSSAERTRGTWQQVAAGAHTGTEPTLLDELYSAGPETALDLLRAADPAARIVIMIGHNPTMAFLAHYLADDQPDPDAFRELSRGYPTSALTVFDCPGSWTDLDQGTATVRDFHVGRG